MRLMLASAIKKKEKLYQEHRLSGIDDILTAETVQVHVESMLRICESGIRFHFKVTRSLIPQSSLSSMMRNDKIRYKIEDTFAQKFCNQSANRPVSRRDYYFFYLLYPDDTRKIVTTLLQSHNYIHVMHVSMR